MRETVREKIDKRLGDQVWWNDVLQLVKTVLAAVIAWVLAASVLDVPQPFLAPWSALLVVHATVYRTFSKGTQQVAATVVAVLLAALVGELMGLTTGSVAVLLVVALVLGAVPWLGAEATTIATTGLVVLTTGYESDVMLIARLLDTAIGVAVGLAVNVIVWPPLRRSTAASAMDHIDEAIGDLLVDMAGGLGDGCQEEDVTGWIERTRALDGDLDRAWALVRQAQESARMNPRRPARQMRDPQHWHGLLRRMEQSIAEIRSLARTLGGQQAHREQWGEAFADPWIEMLGDTGRAASAADAAALREVRTRLEAFTEDLRTTERSPEWPIYGALIINLRNIIDSMDVVAEANPILGRPLRLRLPGGPAEASQG
jgi:uncharacterized membrane protein YccC